MKILALADNPIEAYWNGERRPDFTGVDLILSSGDLPADYLSFITCFTHAPILYVHGNHDGNYIHSPPEGCECIDGSIYEFNGIRIVGLGGSIRYRPNQPFQYTQKDMDRRISAMRFKIMRKKGFDILLTHSPAFGLGDGDDHAHTGFHGFVRLMDSFQPKYMVHGHQHMEYTHKFARTITYKSTTIINGSGKYLFDY